ncbi:MAG: MATE family efflux transporter, partial [Kiritimatiellia bacterium]|nr:MATE family efflux transporter [Kiritimatiellia bacterium]
TAMFASLSGHVVNIGMDYVLIFGKGGFPRMGIAGAAWATLMGAAVNLLVLAILYFRPKTNRIFRTRETLRWDGKLMARMLRFGIPAAVHLVLDIGAFTVFVMLTGRMGGVALTASNIALSINNVAFQPLLGLHMAASVVVGQYQGRKDSATAERAGWTALKIGWLYMSLAAISFLLFPEAYIGLFISKDSTIDPVALLSVSRRLLIMMAAWGLFDTINIILSGALKGAGDTRFVMIYSIVLGWALWIPGEIWIVWKLDRIKELHGSLPPWMGDGILPVWLWMTAFVLIIATGFLWRYRSGRWKTISLIEPAAVILPPRIGADAPLVAE